MDRDDIIYVGGLHSELRDSMLHSLAGFGFSAILDATDHTGTEVGNICNQGSEGRGLQFELSLGARMKMFAGLRASERRITTDRFAAFIAAVRSTV